MKKNYLRVYLIAVLVAGLILLSLSAAPNRSESVGQGKGGEVIAKPTPTPTPKKTTTTKRTPATNSRTGRPAKSASNSATAAEMIFWNSIKDSTNPEDFKAYLLEYPNGKFAALARNRLKNLEAAKVKTENTPNIETGTKPINANISTGAAPSAESAEKRPSAGSVVKNSIGMELVWIPPGRFMMGSEQYDSEKPPHQVTIREGFYMGRYEVTQAQWQQAMGTNPSRFNECNQCPVEQVSWNSVQVFIQKLNQTNDGYTYRLPTEAEWEYACRAGTTTAFAFGDSLSSYQANFDGTYPYGGAPTGPHRAKTLPVGSFQPNAWGLYDMHGNVWEWCDDVWHENYSGSPADGSAWLSGGDSRLRVLRGGGWSSPHTATDQRSANRITLTSDSHYSDDGFRVVAVARTQ